MPTDVTRNNQQQLSPHRKQYQIREIDKTLNPVGHGLLWKRHSLKQILIEEQGIPLEN